MYHSVNIPINKFGGQVLKGHARFIGLNLTAHIVSLETRAKRVHSVPLDDYNKNNNKKLIPNTAGQLEKLLPQRRAALLGTSWLVDVPSYGFGVLTIAHCDIIEHLDGSSELQFKLMGILDGVPNACFTMTLPIAEVHKYFLAQYVDFEVTSDNSPDVFLDCATNVFRRGRIVSSTASTVTLKLDDEVAEASTYSSSRFVYLKSAQQHIKEFDALAEPEVEEAPAHQRMYELGSLWHVQHRSIEDNCWVTYKAYIVEVSTDTVRVCALEKRTMIGGEFEAVPITRSIFTLPLLDLKVCRFVQALTLGYQPGQRFTLKDKPHVAVIKGRSLSEVCVQYYMNGEETNTSTIPTKDFNPKEFTNWAVAFASSPVERVPNQVKGVDQPQVGEHWWVKIGNTVELRRAKVQAMSNLRVKLLGDMYKRADVEFVELVTTKDAND